MATLITGASSGIGEMLARRFAQRGHELILVARRADKLERLADELRTRHQVDVDVQVMDLSQPQAAADLHHRVSSRGRTVDILINNAGFGIHGRLVHADPQLMEQQVALNCQTVVGLTTRFLPAMTARGRGVIINLSSIAGFQPVPQLAVYSASKAFVLTFTEALWAELRGTGVRAFAVCPGPTDTPFFEVAGEAAASGKKRTVDQLVDHILSELDGTRPSFVDGLGYAFVHRVLPRFLPRRLVIRVAGHVVRGDEDSRPPSQQLSA